MTSAPFSYFESPDYLNRPKVEYKSYAKMQDPNFFANWDEHGPKLTQPEEVEAKPEEPAFYITASLLDLPASFNVYLAARALDKDGDGKVLTTYSELANLLNRSVVSTKRYVKQALNLGYFRSVLKEPRSQALTIYLSAEWRICRAVGITKADIRVGITLSHLANNQCKLVATEAHAVSLQKASLYAARFHAPNKSDVLDLGQARTLASSNCTGANKQVNRFLNVKSNTLIFGGSQETISGNMGRSKSTAQRRLSNIRRAKCNLPDLHRSQFVKQFHHSMTRAQAIVLKTSKSAHVVIDRKVRKVVEMHEFKVEFGPNVYFSALNLKSARHLNRKLRHQETDPSKMLRPNDSASQDSFTDIWQFGAEQIPASPLRTD